MARRPAAARGVVGATTAEPPAAEPPVAALPKPTVPAQTIEIDDEDPPAPPVKATKRAKPAGKKRGTKKKSGELFTP